MPICKECKSADFIPNKIYFEVIRTTLMGVDEFYDQAGGLHVHNPNRMTIEYLCSNGHKWEDVSGRDCWCGWKGWHFEFVTHPKVKGFPDDLSYYIASSVLPQGIKCDELARLIKSTLLSYLQGLDNTAELNLRLKQIY